MYSLKSDYLTKALLIIAGICGVLVGIALTFFPINFSASNGIDVAGNTNLLNVTRSEGGALLACGILVVSGAFVQKLTYSALLISVVLYASYGLARFFSIAIDGMPEYNLLYTAVLEIVLGGLSAIAFFRYIQHWQPMRQQ